MKLPALLSASIALLLARPSGAAEDFGSAQPFRAGDTVCFVGDSITHGGTYHSVVALYYATRFPDRELKSYNCGIGGDRAAGIVGDENYRLNVDILSHHPTAATIMLGMNDIGHTDYHVPGRDAADAVQKQARSLEVYDEAMQKLIGKLKGAGARVTLITPSIYDETTQLDRARKDIAVGANGALGKCTAKVHAWAKQYDTGIANFYEVMQAINEREQKKDPTFTLVGPDRVHPGPVGHAVMAYTLLKAQGVPGSVATIRLDARTGKASGEENCRLLDIKAGRTDAEFSCTEKALPLVLAEEAQAALKLVPFDEDLNRELLIVSGMQEGTYRVTIDQKPIGEFTAAELERGVNLATNPETPQYAQAAAVTRLNSARAGLAAQLRSVAAQYYALSKAGVDVSDAAVVEKTLRNRLEASQKDGKPADARLKGAIAIFEKREALANELKRVMAAMREASQPKAHFFVISPK